MPPLINIGNVLFFSEIHRIILLMSPEVRNHLTPLPGYHLPILSEYDLISSSDI